MKIKILQVVGCDRSGTTFLATRLAENSNSVRLPEAQWLGLFSMLISYGLTPRKAIELCNNKDYLRPWVECGINYKEFISLFPDDNKVSASCVIYRAFSYAANQSGYSCSASSSSSPIFIEHTPWATEYLYHISKYTNLVNILHIVRNPRSVCESIICQDWGPNTSLSAAAYWSFRTRASIEIAEGYHRAIRMRYEDLSLFTDDKWIDLAVMLKLPRGYGHIPKLDVGRYAAQHSNVDKKYTAISPRVLSKYKEDVGVFAELYCEIARLLNYEINSTPCVGRLAQVYKMFDFFFDRFLRVLKSFNRKNG